MSIELLLSEINIHLDVLKEIKDSQHKEKTNTILDAYGDLFDLLLIDSNSTKSIFNKLETPEEVRQYCQKLIELNDNINHLPDNFEYKLLLLERFQNGINLEVIKKFELIFNENPEKAYQYFLEANQVEDICNSVEVRTWGTQKEYSTGLRNVIQQKLRDDDVGHAALVMRLPVNDENKILVEKYCTNKSMTNHIPVKTKQFHGKPYYEIYWSFWPGKLQSIEGDCKMESSNIEYREAHELAANVPLELSNMYLLHRNRQGRKASFASPAERIKDGKEVSKESLEIIKLYESLYKLNEENGTINLLHKNYLAKGKTFCPKNCGDGLEIPHNSNFLIIIARFKNEFKNKKVIAKILLDKKITKSDAEILQQEIEALSNKKLSQIATINTSLQNSSHAFSDNKYQTTIEQVRDWQGEKDIHEKVIKKLKESSLSVAAMLSAHITEEGEYQNNLKAFENYNKKNNDLQLLTEQISTWNKILKRQSTGKNGYKISFTNENLEEQSLVFGNKDELEAFINKKKRKRDVLEKDVRTLKVLPPKKPTVINLAIEIELIGMKKIFNAKSISDLQGIAEAMENETLLLDQKLKNLDEKINLGTLQSKVVRLKSDHSLDHLISKKIRRGMPYNSSTLKGIDIEAMLKKASELAANVDSFHLKDENCSTTCLKILKQGVASKKDGDAQLYSELFNYTEIPEVAKKYKLALFSEASDFKMEAGAIYISTVNGMIAYSLLTENDKKIEKIIIDNFNATEPLDIDEIKKNKYRILEHASANGYIPEVKFDSSTFLSNPQAVYSAARLYQKLDSGDESARKLVNDFLKKERDNRELYGFINEMASKSDSELKELKTSYSVMFRFLYSAFKKLGFISFITSLRKLYSEYNSAIKDDQIVETTPLLGHVETAIKELHKNKFYYVASHSIPGAVSEMLEDMRASPYVIPFFDHKFFNKVERHIIELQAKPALNPRETALIANYRKIIEARNNRIKLVEDAVVTGKNVKTHLLVNHAKLDELEYELSPEEMIEHKVGLFIKAYQYKLNYDSEGNRRNTIASMFYRLKHNFINKLLETNSFKEKFQMISDHIADKDQSWSSSIWQNVVLENILVKKEQEKLAHKQNEKHQIEATDMPSKKTITEVHHLSLFKHTPASGNEAEHDMSKVNYHTLRMKLLIDNLLSKIKTFHAQNEIENRNMAILDLSREVNNASSMHILTDKLLLDKDLLNILDIQSTDRDEVLQLACKKLEEYTEEHMPTVK